MASLTPQLADTIYSWANACLVVGAVLALVGTMGAYWSGGIREKFSDERIAVNEAETARAKADAAQANLEQARLKLEMAWRRVTNRQATLLIDLLKGQQDMDLWLSFVKNDPETEMFRTDIDEVLKAAGMTPKFFSGYAQAVGLTLNGGSEEQRKTLLDAFHAAGLPLTESHEPPFFNGAVEILVGTKPPPNFDY
jgi:hypothetical protein